MGDWLGWAAAWAVNKTRSTKTRMHGRGGKCSFCKHPFGPHEVSRSVMTAGGGAREACNRCASSMGVNKPVNVIAHPPKPATKQNQKQKNKKHGSGDPNYGGYG